jgi:hypothetical protein
LRNVLREDATPFWGDVHLPEDVIDATVDVQSKWR